MRPADWISALVQPQLPQAKEPTMTSRKKGMVVSRSRVAPCGEREAEARPGSPPPPRLREPRRPARPREAPRPHLAEAGHAQRLHLGRQLLPVVGAQRVEKPPRDPRLPTHRRHAALCLRSGFRFRRKENAGAL